MVRSKYTFRYWVGRIHLWLGLISGLIVFVVAITGCIFVFQDEIKDACYEYRKIEVEAKPFLPLSALKDTALSIYPKGTVSRIVMFDKGRPATVLLKSGKESYYVFINPYSGKILHHQNMRSDFFITVQFLHMYLLLPKPIGQPIVDIAVIVFVVLLITGLILWWPRKRAQRKQAFTIKFRSRWRRVNYDLHNVMGFYVFIIALIIAITGLSMGYDWVKDAIKTTANLGKTYSSDQEKAFKSDTAKTALLTLNQLIDNSYNKAKQSSPEAAMFTTFLPQKKDAVISVTAYKTQLHFYKRNEYYFDQYSGTLLKEKPHESKSPGAKMNAMNYDLHTGQILGITGKIIAFLASLAAASLPITGFMVWLGRKKKQKKWANK